MEKEIYVLKQLANGRGWVTKEDGSIEFTDGEILTQEAYKVQEASLEADYLKFERKRKLASIFAEKAIGLKRLAIDKPYMTNAQEVNEQYAAYEAMYEAAKNGAYDEATNTAIINANETAKMTLAPVNLLLNSIRSLLEQKIEENASDIDILLDKAKAISLSKDELTPETLENIKADFYGTSTTTNS